MKQLAAGAVGLVVGFVLATYGSGQAIAIATAERDAERDELADSHTRQVKAVIESAAKKLDKLHAERDEALAQLELLKPKAVSGEGVRYEPIEPAKGDAA